MEKKISLIVMLLALVLPLVGCHDVKVKRWNDIYPNEGQYTVFGRIMNQQDRAVENCQVMLVKRQLQYVVSNDSRDIVDMGQKVVASTSLTGDYSFRFEPTGANNLWVYFKAEGYGPRWVELDRLMEGPLFRTPSAKTLNVSLILEEIE